MITNEALEAKIREIAAASPDFIYSHPPGSSACVYVHEGKGSCIVGKALIDLGVPVEFFQELGHNTRYIGAIWNDLNRAGYVGPQMDHWVADVQHEQDDNKPWGLAVEIVDSWKVGTR